MELNKTDQYSALLTDEVIANVNRLADETLLSIYKTDIDLLFDPSMLALFSYYKSLEQLGEERENVFAVILRQMLFSSYKEGGELSEEEQKKQVDWTRMIMTMSRIGEELEQFKSLV